MSEFGGFWHTTFGPMELTQDGGRVHGSYLSRGSACAITGAVENGRLVFRYEEPGEQGDGWFEQPRYGKFAGQWRPDGHAGWLATWQGHREWDGIWNTTFGPLRLIQERDRVFGFYEGAGPSHVEGRVEDGRLRLRYLEPQVGGEAQFALSDDLQHFAGQWRPDGRETWSSWEGRRVHATPGLTWLMVFEAHWQRTLADQEYAFGHMLREFFARLPNVAVRQRFFNDDASLQRWCRGLLYVPEPAIVSIASHGTPQGLSVEGRTIDTRHVIDSLRHAEDVRLLHFSACLVLQEEQAGDFGRRVERALPFPVSGYTTAVDWGGSAILEFNYFDMILAKGYMPAEAAALLPRLVRYAGDETIEGSPYAPAGFRFFPAGGRAAEVEFI